MLRRAWLAVVLLFAAVTCAPAQVQVSAQVQRSYFLLFERVDVMVTLTNIGNSDLELNNDEGRPWLGFMVSGESLQHVFMPVHSERQSQFAALTLKQGETKTLRVNITPLYSFREEGNYRAAAVIDLPGEGQVVSEPVAFSVQRGHSVVSRVRMVDTLERDYSLIRFSPNADLTRLYLRVEAPTENVVYANLALGELVSAIDPDLQFDPQGNVHVLQCSALSTYLYTRADPDGKVLDQRVFKGVSAQPRPRLVKLDDGSVVVQGGIEQDPNTQRDKLSDHQQGEKMEGPGAPGMQPTERSDHPTTSQPAPSPIPTPAEITPPPPEINSAPAGDPGSASKPNPSGP